MGSNGGDHTKIPHNDAAECSETTVEIKIKTLDSQTFTMRVDKYVPVPELKDQIASVTGVLSEQQRLICRGKVLKDDQLLSAYHVEDGHTLHLVVRQPIVQLPESSLDQPAIDPTSSTGLNPGNRSGPGVVVGTFNISEQGDGAFPDLNRIVSAVLNSFGISRLGNGGDGIDLNQPPSERLSTAPGLRGPRNPSRLQPDQPAAATVPVEALQPPIIPDSLTTLLHYLSHLRQEFIANAGGQISNSQNAGFSVSDGEELDASVNSSESRGLLTPESLAEVMTSTRQLLAGHATECLLQLAGQLACHTNVTDPLERSRIQSSAIRSGALFQNFGALLLELGRAIMTLRMGQAPVDAMVNAGPPVFVSSTGPNPIMVQPLPFQPGASFGSIPVGTVQHGSGLAAGSVGSGFLPRNIDIRIRTGSVFPRRETTGSQPLGQGAPVSSNTVNSGQQDAEGFDSNSQSREPQVRAIPIRTVVAAVPGSVGRHSDSSRNSIGILYPVLARVQQVTTGNPNGTLASQALDQHHGPDGNTEQPVPDSATRQLNAGVTGGNGSSSSAAEALSGQGFSAQIQNGLEQLLRTIFPGEQAFSENANPPGPVLVQSHTEATQDDEAAASTVSDEGILFSNILRRLLPMITENAGVESNLPSTQGAYSDETQIDENTDEGGSSSNRRSPQSPQSSKRQRRE